MAEIEETLKRIQAHKGVIGTIVVNSEDPTRQKGTWEMHETGPLTQYKTPHGKMLLVNCIEPAMLSAMPSYAEMQGEERAMDKLYASTPAIPIRTTLDNPTTVQYAGLLHELTRKAKSTVRDMDPQNDLTFLRIRSKKHEIMVAPDENYLLIAIQNPCE